jgi:3-phenylpropionate/cinnamic acid dioxygenase small subunit
MSTDLSLLFEVQALYTECCNALDEQEFERFLGCFASECSYSIHAKENIDRNWPIAFVSCPSRGALIDRVTAIQKSSFIIPRVQRRIVSGIRVASSGSPLRTQASFAVFETFEGEATTFYAAGRFDDTLRREQGALKFAQRKCILDSSIVRNSLPYPI